jgi:hypothetical protein
VRCFYVLFFIELATPFVSCLAVKHGADEIDGQLLSSASERHDHAVVIGYVDAWTAQHTSASVGVVPRPSWPLGGQFSPPVFGATVGLCRSAAGLGAAERGVGLA